MSKQAFTSQANSYGVKANYSGGTNTMFVKGEETKVKSFIRVCNLKGKGAYPFSVKQGN